ncbi:hypothetical protein [Embleya sp. AB8]|uniref:hypothetical protein n=1 Tax=Embleya sp. AB8 TaxID=3156304 RepID=UPI003C71ADFF
MDEMKILGLYDELWKPGAGKSMGSILDARGDDPLVDEAKILAYLEAGTSLFDFMAFKRDVFGGEENIPGAGSPMTDGEWIWKRDLLYYLPVYHVLLNPDFLDHVRAIDYRMPEISDERIDELSPIVLDLV